MSTPKTTMQIYSRRYCQGNHSRWPAASSWWSTTFIIRVATQAANDPHTLKYSKTIWQDLRTAPSEKATINTGICTARPHGPIGCRAAWYGSMGQVAQPWPVDHRQTDRLRALWQLLLRELAARHGSRRGASRSCRARTGASHCAPWPAHAGLLQGGAAPPVHAPLQLAIAFLCRSPSPQAEGSRPARGLPDLGLGVVGEARPGVRLVPP